MNSCFDGFDQATDYNSVAASCFCAHGVAYLDCFASKIATGSCASDLGITGNLGCIRLRVSRLTPGGRLGRVSEGLLHGVLWKHPAGRHGTDRPAVSFRLRACERAWPWRLTVCADLACPWTLSTRRDRAPASLTSTDSASRTVKVITATTSRKEPDYAGQPNYKGEGDLLQGPCSQTGFTQVDAGSTVYYAGFVGCIRDRPECCPYAVETAMASAQATDAAGIQVQDNKDLGFDFPQPVSSDSGMQTKCAEDYYSISGGCCPKYVSPRPAMRCSWMAV